MQNQISINRTMFEGERQVFSTNFGKPCIGSKSFWKIRKSVEFYAELSTKKLQYTI